MNNYAKNKTKPQTKNIPNMSASRRKDKYILGIHKMDTYLYIVMKKNESDIHVGQKKKVVDMIQYNAIYVTLDEKGQIMKQDQ